MVNVWKCGQCVTVMVVGSVYNVNSWILNVNWQFSVMVPVIFLLMCIEAASHNMVKLLFSTDIELRGSTLHAPWGLNRNCLFQFILKEQWPMRKTPTLGCLHQWCNLITQVLILLQNMASVSLWHFIIVPARSTTSAACSTKLLFNALPVSLISIFPLKRPLQNGSGQQWKDVQNRFKSESFFHYLKTLINIHI